MRPPLWLNVEGTGADVTVSLARCRNCGKTKVTSRPCGFDHLAAVMDFNDWRAEQYPEATTPTPPEPQPGERARGEGQ